MSLLGFRASALSAASSLLLAACTATGPAIVAPVLPEPASARAPSAAHGSSGRAVGLEVGAVHVPALWVWEDEDPGEHLDGIELDVDLDMGGGSGVTVGGAGKDGGLRLFYLQTEHRDWRSGLDSDTHLGFLEAFTRGSSPLGDDLSVHYSAGAGVGMTYIDVDDGFPDERGLAGEVRGTVGLGIGRHAALDAGAGMFKFGYPTETVGRGAFVTVGLTLFL
jgi:hypothetical protein